MDDFILILRTKKECIEIKHKIELFLDNTLHLKLNDKSRYYPDKMGADFCGYRIFPTHRLLRCSNKKKIKRKVKKWNNKFNKNTLDIKSANQSIISWIGHSSHCNSYKCKSQYKIGSSAIYLINIVEEPFALINQSYIFHT